MGKYCNQCGTELAQGEVCTCEGAQRKLRLRLAAEQAAEEQIEVFDGEAGEIVEPALDSDGETDGLEAELEPELEPEAGAVPAAEDYLSTAADSFEKILQLKNEISDMSELEQQDLAAPPEEDEQMNSKEKEPRSVVKKLAKSRIAGILRTYFQNLYAVMIQSFKNPAEFFSEAGAHQSISIWSTVIIVEALVFAGFVVMVFGKMNDLFYRNVGGLQTLMDLVGYRAAFPLLRIFLATLVLSLTASILLTVTLKYLHKLILKEDRPYRELCGVASARAAALIPVILISGLFVLLQPAFGIMLYWAGAVLSYYFAGSAYRGIVGEKKKQAVYVLFAALFVTALVISIILMIGYRLYLPEQIISTTWWN